MGLTGALIPIVLIPRFTTYIGSNSPLESVPIDVSAYAGGTIVAWRGPLIGTGVGLIISLIESEDRFIWTTLGSISLSGVTTDTATITLTRRWLRVSVALTGSNPAVTCWCTGHLERRVS